MEPRPGRASGLDPGSRPGHDRARKPAHCTGPRTWFCACWQWATPGRLGLGKVDPALRVLADEREARLLFDAGDTTEPWVGELAARFADGQFVLAVLDASLPARHWL